MNQHILASLTEAQAALAALIDSPAAISSIERAGEMLYRTLESGGRVFSCGNGGSMCDAMHFAEELSGRYRQDRRGLGAVAISDPGYLSCVANDFGYEAVFSRYLEAHARSGDCLVGISTSGKSANVIAAAKFARANGLGVIGLIGRPGTPFEEHVDIAVCTPGGTYADRVQELHIKVIHILIELVERRFFPKNYTASAR